MGNACTPTSFNKRKYTSSNTSASSSVSSSASSLTPSSPASEAGRSTGVVGLTTFGSPFRIQPAKRPRLDLALSGRVGATYPYERQRLAPPPVFRRRPQTPFNRHAGETVVVGDEVEGSGCIEGGSDDEAERDGESPGIPFDFPSDDSLNLTHQSSGEVEV